MERKNIAAEIVIHHYGSGLRIAPEFLPEFERVAEPLNHPTKSCGELGDRLNLRPVPNSNKRIGSASVSINTPARSVRRTSKRRISEPNLAPRSMCGRGKPLAL